MTVDCENPPDSTDLSDPDVSGIGVSIGFVGTGCLMILLLIIYYVFVFDPKLDPLRKQGQVMKSQDRPNAIDVAVLQRVRWALSTLGVAWVVITASWGLKQLLLIRAEGPEDENSWSFGQVAAVVLFISPLCLVLEQFSNPEPADAADTRRSGSTSTRPDDVLEIQPQEPESLDARRESIEWIRLVHITACWDAPSSRATVHMFVGFNFLLMVYAFNDYVVFRAFVKMMTWFFVYQPIQAALVLLLGMELEQTELWMRSHALRRATVVALMIACLLGTIGIFLPSWETPFTQLYICPWEVVPVCLDYLMVGVVVLQFGVYLLIYMARNSSRALHSGG
ncbi:hypothetical protein CGLO_04808 [Colletotrichum gloeosporioides Cg-14]|uniref:Uncharacterized protein n=1 Tax=Colletotrichum gloeosporioides (strain Cg-14) TaxID=1237896 RepID=T0M3C8_COLGC|nr:hypothetical protein CGLO_04808 [Colletotrichum gloeosporioides Cg-14]